MDLLLNPALLALSDHRNGSLKDMYALMFASNKSIFSR